MFNTIKRKIMEFTELDQYPEIQCIYKEARELVGDPEQDERLARKVSSSLLAVATQEEKDTLGELYWGKPGDTEQQEQPGVDRELTIQLFLFKLMKRTRAAA